jgi:hypothetical protein
MFTRLRFSPLGKTNESLARAVHDHFLSLETKGAIEISEASITASEGIVFPATENPKSDPNTLDDYEESTWTPADGSGAGLSITVVSATYTKIGRSVSICASVTYPATASGANAILSGLPFTAGSPAVGAVLSGSAGAVLASVASAAATVAFRVAAGGGNVTNAMLSGTTQTFSLTYFV